MKQLTQLDQAKKLILELANRLQVHAETLGAECNSGIDEYDTELLLKARAFVKPTASQANQRVLAKVRKVLYGERT